MSARKQKTSRRKPDLTIELEGPVELIEFVDKPQGGRTRTSPGVVTSYDPAVFAQYEEMKRNRATQSKKAPAQNGHAGASRIKSLTALLDDCVRTAAAIKSKRGMELVKLLRDARRQADLLDVR